MNHDTIKIIFDFLYYMPKYNFVLSEKTFELQNENDLCMVLKLFSSSPYASLIHWNIIMEVEKDLLEIISSYQWLLRCLKFLNEKNTFLLLIQVSDNLSKMITSSQELGEILSKIPDESNKLRLLKRMRGAFLKQIIHNAWDLGNIFEWLYGDSQIEFIEFLGKDFIQDVFASTNEIIMILHFLTGKNKDYLIDIIQMDRVILKIKTKDNFRIMFGGLSDKKAKEFLKYFSRAQIKSLFSSQQEFYQFLLRLPLSKEKIFLKHLWF